jgi:alkanesulfonate monooxygenase SsuD/methylene tetrahydromethanopterin reductase-like flavin-dependent oxidoreductase (luciferase family)
VHALKVLLSGQELSVRGIHVVAEGANAFGAPVQRPRPPVLVAGGIRRTLALAAVEADIVSISARDLSQRALEERVAWLRQDAGERFASLELNVNLAAVVPEGLEPPSWLRGRLRTHFGVELEDLVATASPFVLSGSPAGMIEQLLRLRETTGVSYVAVSADAMEAVVPVIARLAGS